MDRKNEKSALDQLMIEHTPEWIYITSEQKWQTLSSAVLGGGFSRHHSFVNRHVGKDYIHSDPEEEFKVYLRKKGITTDLLAMMTAARLEDASVMRTTKEGLDLLVIISAGVSNAVDASKAFTLPDWKPTVGTINTWVFIDGQLPQSTYVQALITATEAKTKALHDEKIVDPVTGTLATGTSTDSVMIAATEKGTSYGYAGTITPLGKEMARLVYEGTRETIKRNKKWMREQG